MKVHGGEEIEVIYSCKIVSGTEYLLGIDKNFIENLMENIIEGHQEGEVEDPVIKVDMIRRMVRFNTLLLQNWEFIDLEKIIWLVCMSTIYSSFYRQTTLHWNVSILQRPCLPRLSESI